ncbi:MAG: endopeptidase La [Deltaproteobacteria bacterium]|nr:endopeptidase La [Deltaproteobacteria bacterium]
MTTRKNDEKPGKDSKAISRHQIPLLPLRDVIIFPHMVVPLFVGREKSINALEEAVNKKTDLFLVAQKQAGTVNPTEKDIYQIGTIGTILQILKLPDNTVKVLVEGKKRAMIRGFVPNDRFMKVEVDELAEGVDITVELEAMIRSLKNIFESYVKLNKRIPPEMLMSISTVDDPSRLADIIVAHLNLKLEDKQAILELTDAGKRLERLLALMQGEIEILQVEKRIRTRVKKQMEKSQKEYYLNEQMQAIQKELGEKDEFKAEIMSLEKQVRAKKMSKEATEKVMREIKKLRMMSPMSAEATVVRNYIDWLITIPWSELTDDKIDLSMAQKVLDEDHYGLDEVKERILEYLAVRSLNENKKGSILCFVGPPGVGKTSLARSIAKAMGRKFVRTSLGGVRDEAEIRGHRRTYVGALPGKVIQSMKKAGTANPVFLLDEVDKMSMDFRGDPSSALLEVLDPEQNHNFGDHYLEVDYDLSKVMFILTANSLYNIPKPLLDRMEVIMISGYTEIEKYNIARNYLIPKQVAENGLVSKQIDFTDKALNGIIRSYVKESGVRNTERVIATVCRKVARQVVLRREKKRPEKQLKITVDWLEKHLGPPKFTATMAEEKSEIGLVNGLAWTEVGGDMLQIECTIFPGKGKITITGKLGEVMQESAQAALSFIRSRSDRLGLERDFFEKIDIHIHVPEGSIPKDGPSAGVTMATAIASAVCKIPVKRNVAMTGEITLRGRVLQIGGLKEKMLAAKIGGVDTILIPKQNAPDLKKIGKDILKGLTVIPVDSADDVLRTALELKNPAEFLKKRTIADDIVPTSASGSQQSSGTISASGEPVAH